MEREGTVCGGEHDGEPISCEPFGYTPMVASTPMTVP